MPDARFPTNMRRGKASEYLKVVHGIPMETKTLANRASAGLEPRAKFLGTIPYYDQQSLDRFAEKAFTTESPVTVARRRKTPAPLEQDHAERNARDAG